MYKVEMQLRVKSWLPIPKRNKPKLYMSANVL